MIRTSPMAFALAWLAVASVVAAEPQPKMRVSLLDPGPSWVGQRVILVVELLAPGFFSGTPDFDLPDPPGMLLVPPHTSPTLSTETIDGVSYTVQRHELFIFARRAGDHVIPPITVRFHFKRNPLDTDAAASTLKSEPLNFQAKLPPGAERLGGIISTRNLKAVETWKPQPGKAKAGDAFTRTITFSAPDVPAMAFPPFLVSKIDGMSLYSNPPLLIDQEERGPMQGERRDVFSYVCQRPGTFIVPAARFSWFDLETQQIQIIGFPSRRIDAVANASMASEITSSPGSKSVWPILRAIAAGLLLVLVLVSGTIAAAIVFYRNANRWLAPLRAVHLAPLNPISQEERKYVTQTWSN